jgi:serine/threonine protein kinase
VTSTSHQQLDFTEADAAWDALSQCVEAFIEGWEQGTAPPLSRFLPQEPPALRKLALVELIKVDLEYRAARDALRPLEDYCREFPELIQHDRLPCDLIYEEYHARKHAGQAPDVSEYMRRFPQQAGELARLLGIASPYHTTLVTGRLRRTALPEVGETLDDFDLLAELGRGAFATVFLARQRSLQRLVALKATGHESDEPQTLAQLDHPHIVRVYDQRIVAERKLRLLYMQYLPGGTLQQVIQHAAAQAAVSRSGRTLLAAVDAALQQRGESPPDESLTRRTLGQLAWWQCVAWVGSRLAAALHYAHRRGVLHRDIKPANVLLTAEGSPRLADFNISFSAHIEGASPAAFFGGSVAYMSPEQLEAYDPAHPRGPDELDGRSDQYALGVVLWEMLCGTRPFEDRVLPEGWDATLADMTRRRRSGVPDAALARLPRDCPAALRDILLRCLRAEPHRRFAHAGQLARQLELCLDPQLHQLLQPDARSWRRAAARWPVIALLLVGLLPNAVLSVLNIAYNLTAIVRRDLDAPPSVQAEVAQHFEWVQIPILNLVLYGGCIAACMLVAWRVRQCLRTTHCGTPASFEQWQRAGPRCLALGDWFCWIGFAGWMLAGLLFPAWIDLRSGGALRAEGYFHFLASQFFCGLIAGCLTFALGSYVATSALYPRLLPDELRASDAPQQVASLGRRLWLYLGILVVICFVAVPALVLIDSDLKAAYLGVGLLGAAAFLVALRVARALQPVLEGLQLAVAPLEWMSHRDDGSGWSIGSRSSRRA